MTQSLLLIINSLGSLYLLAILLRLLLQAADADFYNPICQAIHKATQPLQSPLRRLLPDIGRLSLSTLLLALLFNSLMTALALGITGNLGLVSVGNIISWSLVGVLGFILNIYFYGLLISIISSWVAPNSGNPALLAVQQLMEPLQSIFRKVIPPMGGLDFSPIFIFLGIQVVEIMLVQGLASSLRVPGQLVIGI